MSSNFVALNVIHFWSSMISVSFLSQISNLCSKFKFWSFFIWIWIWNCKISISQLPIKSVCRDTQGAKASMVIFTRRKRGECRRCKRTLCRREHFQNAILCWNFFSGSFKRDLMKHTLAQSDPNATVRMTLYWVLFIIMGVVTENSANL